MTTADTGRHSGPGVGSGAAPADRLDRLRQALRANLSRRKAQARARANPDEETDPGTTTGADGDEQDKDRG